MEKLIHSLNICLTHIKVFTIQFFLHFYKYENFHNKMLGKYLWTT